jgi:hypothetical protein
MSVLFPRSRSELLKHINAGKYDQPRSKAMKDDSISVHLNLSKRGAFTLQRMMEKLIADSKGMRLSEAEAAGLGAMEMYIANVVLQQVNLEIGKGATLAIRKAFGL